MPDAITLTAAEVAALLPALENELAVWDGADCGEQQAENDQWVAELRAIRDRLAAA